MQVKQSMISGNGEQKAAQNSKVESVAVSEKVTPNNLVEAPKSAKLEGMSAYLKIVSRLENLNARQDSLPEPAIQGFVKGLQKQLAEMNDHEKAMLLRIPEVKSLNVKNAEELIDKIEDKLTDGQADLKLFELLRQPQFVELIDPSQKMQTYSNKPPTPFATSVEMATVPKTQQEAPVIYPYTTEAHPIQSQSPTEPLLTNPKPQST